MRRVEQPPTPAADLSAEDQVHILSQLFAASEPDSPAAALNARIRKENAHLRGSPEQRLAALRDFIAYLGLSEAADRFLASRAAHRRTLPLERTHQ